MVIPRPKPNSCRILEINFSCTKLHGVPQSRAERIGMSGRIGEIQEVSVDKIKPYERNAKIHGEEQVNKIAESIKEFGFLTPCLIDKDYNLIAGHGRVMAVKKLGMDTVPCLFIEGLTEAQRRAYILADNKLGELAEWNMDLVLSELDDLVDMDFNIEITGFDFPEEIEPTEVIEDEYTEDVDPIVKVGDIWQLGEHRLICGDSTDVNVIDALMGGQKADMVFTDPPYGINIVGDNGKIGADNLAKNQVYSKVISDDTTQTAQDFFYLITQYCERVVMWGGNYFTAFLPPSDGWIIWDKRVDMNGNNFADGEMAWCSFHTPVRIYHQLWSGMIREGEHEKRVHPTQKPVRVLGDILNDFSSLEEIILDGFGGSGSTLIACEQLNRKCFMCELDPHYCDVIIQRWENLTGQKAQRIG